MAHRSLQLFVEAGHDLAVVGSAPVAIRVKVGPFSIRTAPNRDNVQNPQFNWEIGMAYHNQGATVEVHQGDKMIGSCDMSNQDLIQGVEGKVPLTPSGSLQLKAHLSGEVVEGAKVKRVYSVPTGRYTGTAYTGSNIQTPPPPPVCPQPPTATTTTTTKIVEQEVSLGSAMASSQEVLSFADLVRRQHAKGNTAAGGKSAESNSSSVWMGPGGSFILNVRFVFT